MNDKKRKNHTVFVNLSLPIKANACVFLQKVCDRVVAKGLISFFIALFFVYPAGSVVGELSLSKKRSTPVIVVTIKPIFGLVSALLKGIATPLLLNENGGGAHTLSLTPGDIRMLSQADFVVWVGQSYEFVMSKALQAALPPQQRIALQDIPGLHFLPVRTGYLFPGCQHCHPANDAATKLPPASLSTSLSADDSVNQIITSAASTQSDVPASDKSLVHPHTHEHTIDGHFWLDIDNAKICVRHLATQFANRYPDFSTQVKANEKQVLTALDHLDSTLKAKLLPIQNKTALIDHDSLLYLEKRYGFIIRGVLSDEEGVLPSIQHVKDLTSEMDADLEEKLLTCFFFSGAPLTPPSRLLSKLTKPYSLPLIPLDYCSEALSSQAGDPTTLYEQTLLRLAHQLCLGLAPASLQAVDQSLPKAAVKE